MAVVNVIAQEGWHVAAPSADKGVNMSKPIYTVVIDLQGNVSIIERGKVLRAEEVKGTSFVKCKRIKQEIENDNNNS